MKQFLLKLSVAFFFALIIISQQVEAKNTDIIWSEKSKIKYQGFTISKKCLGDEYFDNNCVGKIIKKNKVLARVYSQKDYWIKFSLFNFLGRKDKQLVIQTYSGGAHCCYDYYIFDLKPKFRKIYDLSKFDSANEIGNELIPVDIDKNGIFEFKQDVMAFDYMGTWGHITATFPPAIFHFNKKKQKFALATKRFPNFVLKELKENISSLDDWIKETSKTEPKIKQEEIEEIKTRETFLYLVYAGKREDAWKLFEEKYNFQFRDKFRNDFKELFSNDPTYLSIYGK